MPAPLFFPCRHIFELEDNILNDFELYSVVNSCYMGRNFHDRQRLHTDRYSHGFVYFKYGNNVYDFEGGKQIVTGTGCFLYLPKHSTYTVGIRDVGEVYCVNIECNDDVFGNSLPNEGGFSLPLKRELEVEGIYKRIVRESYLKRPYHELTLKSLVYELAAIILSEKNAEYLPSGVGVRLAPAVSYIDEHYIEKSITVPFLASLCDMSENYFRRLFTKYFGMSPMKYVNEKRIKYASDFLRSGLYTVTEVAEIAGFDDIGYFSRVCKKITGEAPSLIKKRR